MPVSRIIEQFGLRLPEGLRDRIKEEATQNHRSMNSEIVFCLERVYYDRLEMKKGNEVSA